MRFSVKICGSSGVLSSGKIFSRILLNNGFFCRAEREFPSRIKGGDHSFLLDFSKLEIMSNSKVFDLICNIEERRVYNDLFSFCFGDDDIISNSFLIGLLCGIFGFKDGDKEVEAYFKTEKDENVKSYFEGFKAYKQNEKKFESLNLDKLFSPSEMTDYPFRKSVEGLDIVNGNEAIAISVINSGLKHYFAYPMSPATSIIDFLDASKKVSTMICGDEISAVNMCLGAMYENSNALTATSSGGFDLMTETISASGVMEIPLVVVLSQRPGPGTGLPTWDSQDNLNISVYGGHGDFPRAVLSVSDAESGMRIMKDAFLLAKKYKIPVIVLSQKSISEGYYTEKKCSKVFDYPFSEKINFVTADEHDEFGRSLEACDEVISAVDRRFEKVSGILKDMPKPFFFGPKNADISFLCFGSIKGALIDAIMILKERNVKANMLCLEGIWPIDKELILDFFDNNKKVCVVEQNKTGQLEKLIEGETKVKFYKSFRKYDGKSVRYEDILNFYDGL